MLSVFMDLDFRSVWTTLSLSNKLFLLFFCGVSFYTLWLSFRVLYCVNAFKKQRAGNPVSVRGSRLDGLRKRLGNLRQLHLLTLYVLWLCIVVNIPSAFNILGLYKTIPIGLIFNNLAFLFHYYAPIFLVFVLLHSLQWFVSVRVDVFERRESA
jgi:hypothetical protein